MEAENGDSSSKMENYEVIEQIGRGSFAATFLVLHKTENKKYVLKKISLSKQTDKFKRTALQEINIVAKLRHPYIVEFKDAWIDEESSICIITNYCERGDMSQIVKRARGTYFPEEVVCKWLTQMLLAIDYLHSNRVHHRDLKLSNILVTKENDIRLGDFGLSRLFDEEGVNSSVVGMPNYMLPELLGGALYGYKSDIWSLGCCIFEIAARQQAFKASDMAGLINKINRSLISPLPILYSASLKQIIKTMLRKSPEHRPTAAELLRNSHLQRFLLRCHEPSSTFLPVKSPSPKSTNDKKTSSSGSKPKQKDLLPLFDEMKDTEVPSLLDSDLSIDYMLETKRVDPTSYSGKISSDSNGDDESNASSSSSLKVTSDTVKNAPLKSDKSELSPDKLAGFEENEETVENSDPQCSGSSSLKADSGLEKLECDKNGTLMVSHGQTREEVKEEEKKEPQRADALESLLELCADLLKKEKLDELNGILKPFGDETVSSRETAIWLTKSLINGKKMAKNS